MAAIAFCIATGVSSFAIANQSAETALPSELASTLPSVELVGKGKLTFFGLEVYESSLWATPSFKGLAFENHNFALELHYLRNFTAIDIAKRSIEEMQRIEPVSDLASLFGTTANAVAKFVILIFQGSFSAFGCLPKPLSPNSGKRF
ncbi:MAG: hypothetical protein RJB10_2019 [Pseudomonadota bacterium]